MLTPSCLSFDCRNDVSSLLAAPSFFSTSNKPPKDRPRVKGQRSRHPSILTYPTILFKPTWQGSGPPPSQSNAFGLKMTSFKNAPTSRCSNALNSYCLCTTFIRHSLFSVYNKPYAFLIISKLFILGNIKNINVKEKSPITL